MIFDSLSNFDRYKDLPNIHRALSYINDLDFQNLPTELLEIDGNKITAKLQTRETKPLEECKFEAHRRYIDIHITLSEVEGIGIRNTAELESEGSYDPEHDIEFFTGDHHCLCFIHPGEFLVCFPNDAHKVAIMKTSPSVVKKFIIKILDEA